MERQVNLFDMGGTAEVANLLECKKQQIHALRKNHKFPLPLHTLASTPLWHLPEVEAFKATWKRRTKKEA